MPETIIPAAFDLRLSSLRDVQGLMRPLFTQASVAAAANGFLETLLGDQQRKTGWMRAEAAGDPGPWRQQAILGRRRWDADQLRDIVRTYALEALSDANAVLVIDETGFLKQGKSSCGVERQYSAAAGRVTNCQVGIFAGYFSCHGRAFIDRELFLPKSWTDHPERLASVHVPSEIKFSSKSALSVKIIERALTAEVPFRWVATDCGDDGAEDVELALRQAGRSYVIGLGAVRSLGPYERKLFGSVACETIANGLDAMV